MRASMLQSPRHLHWPGVHRHRGGQVQRSQRRGDGGARRGIPKDVLAEPVEPGNVRKRQDYEPSWRLLRGKRCHVGRRT